MIVKRSVPKVITKFGPGVATKDRDRAYIYKFYKHAYGKFYYIQTKKSRFLSSFEARCGLNAE